MKKLPNERVAVCVQLDRPTHAMLKALVEHYNADMPETWDKYSASSYIRRLIQIEHKAMVESGWLPEIQKEG